MRRIEEAMNRLTDIDAGWWPLLRLRPQRSERMDNGFLLRMAVYYGCFFGLLVYGWYVFVDFMPLSAMWLLACVAAAIAFMFIGYKYTFALSWNRRADRLQPAAQVNPSNP
jgi:hypothetical protein